MYEKGVVPLIMQLSSGAFEQSKLCMWEIYDLLNVVFYIAVYSQYKS